MKSFIEILNESNEEETPEEIEKFIRKAYDYESGSLAKSMVKLKYGMIRNRDFKLTFKKDGEYKVVDKVIFLK